MAHVTAALEELERTRTRRIESNRRAAEVFEGELRSALARTVSATNERLRSALETPAWDEERKRARGHSRNVAHAAGVSPAPAFVQSSSRDLSPS
jgi:hypothetical protein